MRSRALNLAALALLVSACGWTTAGVRTAAAQALDAGKPPAQIFSGTCSACHRSPRGLVRSVSPGSLPGFLRQHYTTGNEMAGTMAAYVLGNGGTDRVAEPPKREPKQEPKQKARPDTPEVAARTPEQGKDQSKSARQQRAGKKGPEPAAKDAAPAPEPEKIDAAKTEAAVDAAKTEAAVDAAKTETAATDCKVEEPVKQAAAPATDAVATADATPPRQPTSLLTLPGFPAPVPEPEPAVAAAPPGCDPAVTTTAAAKREEAAKEPAKDPPKEAAREQAASPPAAPAPAAMAEAPKSEPLRPAMVEAATHPLDIMQEEVHGPRPVARAPPQQQQKKRAP